MFVRIDEGVAGLGVLESASVRLQKSGKCRRNAFPVRRLGVALLKLKEELQVRIVPAGHWSTSTPLQQESILL